ncbi:actin-binding Rho-activating protein [Xenopus laevis]|uniref:Actin-binding Rho-activating protein n=2 Tax=Xenopus laevis TaxID=8355 RepID=A0A1L8FZR7_XENLA|nr:actin-binding Rho-activating protein [Xenopus laevis]OCT77085.1 hypothetical protein XELAEV_18032280mg [Xenopus laevis]
MVNQETKTMKPAQRAMRKIRTASLVSSLTKGWQQWACEHSTKQAQEPSGWVPNTEKDDQEHEIKFEKQTKPTVVAPRKDPKEDPTDDHGDALIRTKTVTKSFASKAQERGNDICSLTERYEKDPSLHIQNKYEDSMVEKILQGNISPTRRRKCSNLVSQLTKGWKQMEQVDEEQVTAPSPTPKLKECRSESLETEDSGYGEGDAEGKSQVDNKKEPPTENQEDTARIKQSYSSRNNKATGELENINKAYKRYSPVDNIKGRWEKWSNQHALTQKLNPFSEEFDQDFAMSRRLHKGDKGYGHPEEGTKTAERATRAEAHIHREMKDLCFVISTLSDPDKNGTVRVTFGELFDRYVRISDKVVGILLRARKHGMVDFPGEMLWQGRDDHVIITLL